MGRYEVTSNSNGVMRSVPALRDLAATTIFTAQCIEETVYMTAVTASMEFLTLVDERLDLGVMVRVRNCNWNAGIQHKNAREDKDSGVYS